MAEKKSIGYDKILLGVGALVAVGMGALVMVKAGSLESDFETSTGAQNDPPELAGEALIEDAMESLGKETRLKQVGDSTGRPVDLFTGIPLYVPSGGGAPIDLLDPDSEPVHPPIPNKWWYDNSIDPGFADSPQRDEDLDGFTNLEEYEAGTDPADDAKFPSLVDKLELVELKERAYAITFSSEAADTYQFRYEDVYTGTRRRERTDYIPAGDPQQSIFFTEGPATLRFRLKAVEDREVENERTGVVSTVKFAVIEDLHPNKQGDIFEVAKGSSNRVIRKDYTAILTLNAAGGQGINFEVEENNSFSLPYDENAAEKPYTFTGVNDSGQVVITYQQEGQTQEKLLDAGGE